MRFLHFESPQVMLVLPIEHTVSRGSGEHAQVHRVVTYVLGLKGQKLRFSVL